MSCRVVRLQKSLHFDPRTNPLLETGNQPGQLRRGKSLLGRDSDQEQGGIFRRGTLRGTLRRKRSQANATRPPNATQVNKVDVPNGQPNCCPCLGDFVPGPKNAWMVYCYFLTICIPNWALKSCAGKKTPEAQRAWREKVGIVSIVLGLMGAVGFLTFGFTQTVCGLQPLKIRGGEVRDDSVVINGMDYDLGTYEHPAVDGVFNGTQNPLYMDQYMAGAKDLSFLFQRVNQNCLDVITPAADSGIRHDGNRLAWYFPCNIHSQHGTSESAPVNLTGLTDPTNCHTSEVARNDFNSRMPTAEVYYTWAQVRNESRSLAVYKS